MSGRKRRRLASRSGSGIAGVSKCILDLDHAGQHESTDGQRWADVFSIVRLDRDEWRILDESARMGIVNVWTGEDARRARKLDALGLGKMSRGGIGFTINDAGRARHALGRTP